MNIKKISKKVLGSNARKNNIERKNMKNEERRKEKKKERKGRMKELLN